MPDLHEILTSPCFRVLPAIISLSSSAVLFAWNSLYAIPCAIGGGLTCGLAIEAGKLGSLVEGAIDLESQIINVHF